MRMNEEHLLLRYGITQPPSTSLSSLEQSFSACTISWHRKEDIQRMDSWEQQCLYLAWRARRERMGWVKIFGYRAFSLALCCFLRVLTKR